ncbi:hypothetical protein CH295_26815 [Rhodococcus sp. 14-2483-1-2]|nr:hypothetical protein CH295_26815 [Rhodococcus sp. 14-2483-1-2]
MSTFCTASQHGDQTGYNARLGPVIESGNGIVEWAIESSVAAFATLGAGWSDAAGGSIEHRSAVERNEPVGQKAHQFAKIVYAQWCIGCQRNQYVAAAAGGTICNRSCAALVKP